MKTFTVEEVAHHNQPSDLWIIVKDQVYDVSKFSKEHPGGKRVLEKVRACNLSFPVARHGK
jgi:cytochrome b involved in lipid metabolism